MNIVAMVYLILLLAMACACRGRDSGSLTKQLWDVDPVEVEVEEPDPPPPLGPEPSGKPTRYPIVIANGMISNGDTLRPAIEAMRQDGHQVFLTQVPAAHPVAVRVQTLKPQIEAILKSTGAAKVNIMAYSLGSLDARWLAASGGMAKRIASITSLSGVNHGTPAGQAAYELMMAMPEGWREKFDAFASLVGARLLNPLLAKSQLTELAYDLSPKGVEAFAKANPDAPGVYYQSYAGLSSFRGHSIPLAREVCGTIWGDGELHDHLNLSLYAAMKLLAPDIFTTPSDGAISVASQKHGAFRGCIPIDHWGIIGSSRAPGLDPNTGFELTRFYRYLAYDLAKLGH